MIGGRVPHVSSSLRPRWSAAVARSWAERMLIALGAHPAFAESVLGDMAEEQARRDAEVGPLGARWWYAREAFRAVPHLLWNAARHGGARGRARAATVLAAAALLPFVSLLALRHRDGPPARLLIGSGDVNEGLILNGVRPVRLPLRVLDAKGHVLQSSGVRYQWRSGAPIEVAPAGVIRCVGEGDAILRASLGSATTDVRLRCRPVKEVEAPALLHLVVGGASQSVPFEARDSAGRPVTLLSGRIAVTDTSVVTLTGSRIRGRTAGSAWMTVRMGDGESVSAVHVYERVASLEGIRPGQHLAVSVRVSGEEVQQWHIPPGNYLLGVVADGEEQAKPRLAIIGANCVRSDYHLLCAAPHGAEVVAYHPQNVDPQQVLRGDVAVWRREVP
ncbi:hypothetical protein BH09GEM1_BH09GEM1_47750 [soil metagenome]